MRIAIGSDHRGVAIRHKILEFVAQLGHEALDFGSYEDGPVDYA